MSMILEVILNPFILMMISGALCLIVGLFLGVYQSQPRRNMVIQISPDTGRGLEFSVKEEDTVNLNCSPVGSIPPQRFIKLLDAYNIVRKGFLKLQNYALWCGMTGTAYTYPFDTPNVKTSLEKTMKNIMGEEDYKKTPLALQKKIAEAKIGVTVEFPKGYSTPINPIYDATISDPKDPRSQKFLPAKSSDDLRRGDVDRLINIIARRLNELGKKTGGESVIKVLVYLGCGGGLFMLALLFTGHLK